MAAKKRNETPLDWTGKNISQMKSQIDQCKLDFDWIFYDELLMATHLPNYYQHSQHLFIRLFKAGLIYRKDSLVWWDPIDQTVLANEQVDKDGRAERSNALVQVRFLNQYFIRISDYAERLFSDLDHLDGWPDWVKLAQKNWIGKTSGKVIQLKFQLDDHTWIPLDGFLDSSKLGTYDCSINSVKCGANNPTIQNYLNTNIILRERFSNWLTNTLPTIAPGQSSCFSLGKRILVDGSDQAFELKVDTSIHDSTLFLLDNSGAENSTNNFNISIHAQHEKDRYQLRDWLVSRQRKWVYVQCVPSYT
jgi:leucyl-tRNA synthetase